MMTPTRIVRFLGFAGLVAFFGLVASSRATIQARVDDDRLAPPPPPITADAPASKPVLVSEPTDLPPEPSPDVAPLPLPEPAADKPKAPSPAPRPISENPEAAPIPRAPEPVGLEAAAFGAEPRPIAESAPSEATALNHDADQLRVAEPPPAAPVPVSASASDEEDPEKQARSFVERNRKEAEAQLKALNAEAAQLRARLGKIESGIRRWQALADAMDRTEESASIQDLDPLPRASRPTSNRRPAAAVIHSTPDDDPVTRAQFVPAPLPR